MLVFQTIVELQKYLLITNDLSLKKIGFVPTMGALHEGHMSLIDSSKKLASITVCSIFVNPTQFNDKNDYDKYPIQLDKDLEMLIAAKCDVVFVPTVEEIYPNGTLEKTDISLGFIGTTLEGAKRPGHFEGVLQVVKRLLDIVQPDILFLGQKDYQQCMVLNALIQQLHLPIQLEICETLREKDGLAMSSRNARLTENERSVSVKLSQALLTIKSNIKNRAIPELIETETNKLNEEALIELEYLVVVNGTTLEPLEKYDEKVPITVLIAAKVGQIRLIDNMIIQKIPEL